MAWVGDHQQFIGNVYIRTLLTHGARSVTHIRRYIRRTRNPDPLFTLGFTSSKSGTCDILLSRDRSSAEQTEPVSVFAVLKRVNSVRAEHMAIAVESGMKRFSIRYYELG